MVIARFQRGSSSHDLAGLVDLMRIEANRKLAFGTKQSFGQFLTPAPIAKLMASMIRDEGAETISILDPGAGVGSLFSSVVDSIIARSSPPRRVVITAYEIDFNLGRYATSALHACAQKCEAAGISFDGHVIVDDFVAHAATTLSEPMLNEAPLSRYSCVVMNPPYQKLDSKSQHTRMLDHLGMKTGNLYSAFMYLGASLLEPGGQLVAITPRSYANGPYFKPFRRWLIDNLRLDHIHEFDSREEAFSDDEVLQENIIIHATRAEVHTSSKVVITSSAGPQDQWLQTHTVPYETVVRPDDPHAFIRITKDRPSQIVAEALESLPCQLGDLSLEVSTGRVVDFRVTPFLRAKLSTGDVPLIYPNDLVAGNVAWTNTPRRKPRAIANEEATAGLLVSNEPYVLVKRFTSKEEPRRIVAAFHDPSRFPFGRIGFENHINYFHSAGHGINEDLARGLTAFLNSSVVDCYFRQFSGHTQVNASDLRSLRYPSEESLVAVGQLVSGDMSIDTVDKIINEEILSATQGISEAMSVKRKLKEALEVLRLLGLPRQQQNERSALTLLALLGLGPSTPWAQASDPLMGITPMMTFFANEYGKTYAPNTRETVRRQTVHQFIEAGFVLQNPDDPSRPTNSPASVYQVEPGLLELLQGYGTEDWEKKLSAHLASIKTLKEKYAQERQMVRIPVHIPDGEHLSLSPGAHSILIGQIVKEFAERFTPGGTVVYVGDTGDKFAHFDEEFFKNLGLDLDPHGKMPDVVIFHEPNNWLVMVEAVTSHGPVDPKRRAELTRLFKDSRLPLVFVTAFLGRKALVEFLPDISWETEVWIADTPDHLIHFNGERFLGPY